jgi:tRNA threonylcarbamoyladenosine biosynthesis protein TsaE
MSSQFTISNADSMREFAGRVAQIVRAGDVIVLDGPLGAGKTTFTQGLGQALDVEGAVTSPTFVVCRIHKARKDIGLIHVDAYRLNSVDELFDLELDDLRNNVLVMEWGLPFVDSIAESWLHIAISRDDEIHIEDPASGERIATVVAHGIRWSESELESLRA